MGLLDDAIKQHLELKRKHGAGEDEVKRQEAEALGPARRDFAAPAAAEEAPAPEAPVEAAPADTWLDEPPAPVERRTSDTPTQGFPAISRDEVEDEVEAEAEADEADEEEADEDVLEETPDFLQDTPEHDRLWFEQNPPRDFDFDG